MRSADCRDHGALIVLFPVRAHGDLRHPGILVVNRVARDTHLRAPDILREREAMSEAERSSNIFGVEFLPRIAELKAIEETERRAVGQE